MPEELPVFSQEEIASWAGLSYQELALKVISPFVDGAIPQADLKQLIDKSYATFRHGGIAPLIQTRPQRVDYGAVPGPNPGV